MNFYKILFRAWSYFRTGYGTYLAFFIGFASNIIVIYQLEIKNVGFLTGNPIFRSQALFALFALAIIIPLCIGAGLYHMKKTGAFAADASLSTESNPYIYKIIPGKEQEVFLPLWTATVRSLVKVLDKQQAMTVEEKNELEEILDRANALMEGRQVGRPSRLGVRTFPVTEGDK